MASSAFAATTRRFLTIAAIARKFDDRSRRTSSLLVDDSHGVGAFGETGRGTEEATGFGPVDLLAPGLGRL